MTNDYHVYFDENYYNLEDFINLFKKYNINNVIFSPPCTKIREPEKSQFMYKIQRLLLMNHLGYLISKYISKSFYTKNDELKLFWKLFSRNRNLIKVIIPDNDYLYSSIKHVNNFKMWYWINPKKNNLNETKKNIELYKDKIFGLKFHQYWHNFNLEEIKKYYELIRDKNLPIYLILNYENIAEIKKFIINTKDCKIIFGYGGFPLFNKIWKLINDSDNCYIDLASNHIDSKIIKKMFQEIDANKIIFSSDCPYNFKDKNNDFNYNLIISRLKFLNENIKKNIYEKKL